MTRKEAAKLLTLATVAWPRLEVTEPMIENWARLLGDVPYQVAEAALDRLMLTSPYPPSLYEMRRQAVIIMHPDTEMDAATAWGEVMQAVKEYGYYRPREGLASLPPSVRRVVDFVGWSELCEAKTDIIRAQFMRMWDAQAKSQAEQVMLPERLKRQIARVGAGDKLKLEEGTG